MAQIGHVPAKNPLKPDTEKLPKPPKDAAQKGADEAKGKDPTKKQAKKIRKGAADLQEDVDKKASPPPPQKEDKAVPAAAVDKPEVDKPEVDKPVTPPSGPQKKTGMRRVPVVKGKTNKLEGPSNSGRTTWDHSALAEARAARAKLDQVRSSMGSDAYSGDIGSYLGKANTLSALARQAEAADRQGSVIKSSDYDSDMGGSTGGYDLAEREVPFNGAVPAAPPKPVTDPVAISTVKAGDPEPNHQPFIGQNDVRPIAKNVTNPNKFRNFA